MRIAPRGSVVALIAALAALPAFAAAQHEPRVLIALDSSRSLSAGQSRVGATLARDLYVRLGATTTPSVLTFDDSVHWLARPGQAGAEAALEALRPSGRFTVLNDGLIEGVRSLEGGGSLVLISDGRDENSATTLEDVARLASERDVRVVTLGVGRVDERTMRRLSLLTGGFYGGTVEGADPDALVAQIEALRRQVEAEQAPPAAAPPVEVVAPAPQPTPPVAATAPSPDNSRLLLLLGALVAVAGVVVGALLSRRRAPSGAADEEELDVGTRPGVEVPEAPPGGFAAGAPSAVDEIELARVRGLLPVAAGGLMPVSLDASDALRNLPTGESIEHTVVLTEEVVLTVRAPGKEETSYRLPPGRAIDIGRDAKRNTLAFPDPTLSNQHLRLVLADEEVLLVDLGSTNGVMVQERRVASARLYPGDHFRAGMIEFGLNLRRAGVA